MRHAVSLLVAAALFTSGCVGLDLNLMGQKSPAPASASPTPTAPAKPVTAEQISEANAKEKANALLEEMKREGRPKEDQR
jgi:hypothetical protein